MTLVFWCFHLWNEGTKYSHFPSLYQDAYNSSIALTSPQLGSMLHVQVTLYAKPETY